MKRGCMISMVLLVICWSGIESTIVNTQYGPVQGTLSNGFRGFRGIPYTESVKGSNRWKPPINKKPWAPNTLDATKFRPCCIQSGELNGTVPMDEDCLYLNVFTPMIQSGDPLLPVMVWIHGGGWVGGCSSQQGYYGDSIANSTKTLLVSINYRLGSLGFLRSNVFEGNFGLMDQVLALQWVKQNIQDFGGDPTKITIFGQSAGAMSVAIHMTSPLSEKFEYFHAAIIQSDPVTIKWRTKEQMIPYSQTFSEYLGCDFDDEVCMRSKSAKDCIAAQDRTYEIPFPPSLAISSMPWEPYLDGTIVVGQPRKLFQEGKFYKVPIIIGTVYNETCSFAFGVLSSLNYKKIRDWEYIALVDIFFQDKALQVLHQYPPPEEGNALPVLIQLTTDYLFGCPSRNISMSVASNGIASYLYQFAHSPVNDPINPTDFCKHGVVCHGADLPYTFYSIGQFPEFNQTTAEHHLAWQEMQYWTEFAATQFQNHTSVSELIPWPQMDPNTLESLSLDTPILVNHGFNQNNCDFWDSIGYDY